MTELEIRRTFPAGARIFGEGTMGDCAYIIEEGEVEISIAREGRDVPLARRGAGEIFGEMAILDEAPRTASATAICECRLLVLTLDQLQHRLERMDPVLRMVLGVVLERFRQSMTNMRSASSAAAAPPVPHDAADARDDAFRSVIDRLELEQELRRGIADDQISFHHQPLVCAQTRRALGYEALARWRHPTLSVVSPGRFISVAEETGLIRQISRLAVTSACATAARLRAGGDPRAYVSANVTVEDICDSSFFDGVADALAAADLAPDALVLEITESTLIDNAEEALAMMARYRDLGVGVSIDDFGAGYSNFSYIARYPVQSVKIDKSVIDRIASSAPAERRRGEELIKAVVSMARGLELKTVAEGVETAEQADALADLGCDLLQGYYFGKPALLFAD